MKTLRKVLAIILVISMVMSLTTLSASASRTPSSNEGYEYIEIFINGTSWKVISGSGDAWLIKGEYPTPVISLSGTTLNYSIGNQTGSVDLPIPTGAKNIVISYNPTVSINSQSASYDNAKIYLTFTEVTVNDVTYHPGSTQIAVTKLSEGATLTEGQFSFVLTETDANWNPIAGGYTATATNSASGYVVFPSISYGSVGTHYYTVSEVNDGQKNWTYSNHVAQVVVSVIKGDSSDGGNVFLWAGASYLNGAVFTNSYSKPTPPYVPVHTLGSVTVQKASNLAVPTDALFTLYKDGAAVASVTYSEFTNGSYTFTGLAEGTYSVLESSADVTDYDLKVTVSGVAELTKSTAANGDTAVSSGTITVTNSYTKLPPPYVPVHTLGSVTINKISNLAVPADALFTLYKDSAAVASVTYSEFTNGSYTFTGLAEGTYSVLESSADVTDYDLKVTVSGVAELTKSTAANGDTAVSSGTITVTNSYTKLPPPYVPVHTLGSVTVQKASNLAVPADALFTLYKDSAAVASVTYSEFTNGSYTFTGLAEGTYSVLESSADVADYDLEVTVSGVAALTKSTASNGDTAVSSGTITVTNSYSLKPIDITVTKIWTDKGDALALRPDSIELALLDAGKVVATATLSEASGWAHTFTALPADGSYTVDELSVPAGYTKSIDGFTVTNTLNDIIESGDPTLPDLTVNKTDAEGKALAGAVFTLSGSGYSISATSGADGKAVFSSIPVGSYTLSETAAPKGYKAIDTVWAVEVSAQKDSYSINVGANGFVNKVWSWVTSIFVNKEATAAITVVNEPELGSLVITKASTGAETPADAIFTVNGPNGYSKSISYSEFTDGKYTLSDIRTGTYTVTESGANVRNYILTVTASADSIEVAADEVAEITIYNRYGKIVVPPTDPDPDKPDPDKPDPDKPDPDKPDPDKPDPDKPDPDKPDPDTPDPDKPDPDKPDPDKPDPDTPDTDEPVDIPDDDVPLAPTPGIELEDIPDEEVPLAQPPQTGDGFAFWLAAFILSAIGLAFTGIKLRRSED